jgi:DNA end-binding protein Ku
VFEQHDLAVEQHVGGEVDESGELREVGRDVAAAAGAQVDAAVADVGEQPHAVPLDLVDPTGTGREVARGGEHGLHPAMLAPMRAMWSGAVSFGLVSVPGEALLGHDQPRRPLPPGARDRRWADQVQRVCTVDGEEVEYADIVKGYETDDGELITLTDEDLDSLPMAAGHEIDVIEFVPSDQIDPMLFEKSYYLEPEAKAAKPYALLREALVQTDRMAVVRFALRQRESIAVLRVRDKVIVLQTMLWPDEIREPDFDILDADVELRPQEQTMAASLVESLGADFDPSQFHDEYRDAVEEMIDRKRTTGETRPAPVATAPADESDSMTDLLSALQASVDAARSKGGKPAEEEKGEKQARRQAVVRGEVAQEGQRRREGGREADAEAQARLSARLFAHEPRQRCGAAEQVALPVVDAECAQVRHHRAPVDVLGHRADPQLPRHPDDGGDQGPVDGVGVGLPHELPGDLDRRERQVLEVGERGVARAEVVEGETAARLGELAARKRAASRLPIAAVSVISSPSRSGSTSATLSCSRIQPPRSWSSSERAETLTSRQRPSARAAAWPARRPPAPPPTGRSAARGRCARRRAGTRRAPGRARARRAGG